MLQKSANLRFLLSLSGTKIVALHDHEDTLHIYSKHHKKNNKKTPIAAEHVAEALICK